MFFAFTVTLALAASKSGVVPQKLSAANATQLKSVFFSGDPWLVQCVSKEDLETFDIDPKLAADEIVEKALAALPKEAQVGLLDCGKRLPSGKSTHDRFKLDTSLTPTLLFAANGKPPAQIKPNMLDKYGLASRLFPNARKQAAALAGLVRARSEPKALVFTKTEHLHSHCLKRKRCVLVVTPGELSAAAGRTLGGLLHEHRAVAFGTINTARYELNLAKALPAAEKSKAWPKGAPQLLAIQSAPTADKKKVALSAKAHRGDFTPSALKDFLDKFAGGKLELTPLKKAPALRWRKQGKEEKGKEEKGGAKRKPFAPPKAGGDKSGAARRGKASAGGGRAAEPGGAGADEQQRRMKMAEEEEEYLRSMFADDEGGGGGGDDDDEVLDLDDEGEPDEVDGDDDEPEALESFEEENKEEL